MTKRKRLIGICLAIFSFAAIIPGATYGIIAATNKPDTINNGDSNSLKPSKVTIEQKGTKPEFLNDIKVNKKSIKSANDLYSPPQSIINHATVDTTGLKVAASAIKAGLNHQLSGQLIDANGYPDYTIIIADVNSYLDNVFKQNNQFFSLKGQMPKIEQIGSDPLAINISGNYQFVNINSQPRPFKDHNGDIIKGLENVSPKDIVNFTFTTKFDKKQNHINGIVTVDPISNKSYLNWQTQQLQLTIGKKITNLTNFVFNQVKSNINLEITDVASGLDPYSAQNDIAGINGKVFNTNTLSGKQVVSDLDDLFTKKLALVKQIAKTVSAIFSSLSQMRANNHQLIDLVIENAGNITDLLTIAKPELNEKIKNKTSIRDLIYDLLTSSKSNNNGKTIYQIIFDNKDILVNFILKNLPIAGGINLIVNNFFNTLKKPEDLFKQLKTLQPLVLDLLKNAKLNSLFTIFQELVATKNVYVLDLLSKPNIAPLIFDLVIQLSENGASLLNNLTPLDLNESKPSQNPITNLVSNPNPPNALEKLSLIDFLKKYKNIFINILANANNPVNGFVEGLLANNKQGLTDLLGMVGFSTAALTPQVKHLFDTFITNNSLLENNPATINKIYTLLKEISALFSNDNLNKIKITINNQLANGPVTRYNKYGDLVISNLNKTYQISVDHLVIKNSLILALVDLMPTSSLSDFVFDNFLTTEVFEEIKDQASQQVKKYPKPWYISWQMLNNGINGINGRPGLIDNVLDGIKRGVNKKATIQSFFKELVFGSLSPQLNHPFMTINGSIQISYTGEDLVILPAYDVDGQNKTIVNYQIIGANFIINATDIAKKSKFGDTTIYNINPNEQSIVANFGGSEKNYISKQLNQSIQQLLQNFLKNTVNRKYQTTTNITLFPKKIDPITNLSTPLYTLDLSDPKQNVAPFVYLNNYTLAVNPQFGGDQLSKAQETILKEGWTYQNHIPKLSDTASKLVKSYVKLSPELKNFLKKRYVNTAINLYGSGLSKLTFQLNQVDIPVVIFPVKIGLTINLSYDIRLLDSITYLPYSVLDTTDHQKPKLVQQVKNFLSYVFVSDPDIQASFQGF